MTPTKLIRRKWSGFIKEGLKLKSMNKKYWAVILLSTILFGCCQQCPHCNIVMDDTMQEYQRRLTTAKDLQSLRMICEDMSEFVTKSKFCRSCLRRVFGDPVAELNISLLYDVKTADGNVYYVSFNFIQSDYCESVHAELISSSSE